MEALIHYPIFTTMLILAAGAAFAFSTVAITSEFINSLED